MNIEFLLLLISIIAVNAKNVELNPNFNRQNKDENVPFSCDFDTNDCGFVLDTTNEMDLEVGVQLVTDQSGYTFTDVSSIEHPTASGEKCKIPFTLGGKVYHHCAPPNLECITDAEGLSKCAKGSFLNGALLQQNSYCSGKFPKVTLTKNGDYKLSFRAFMYCEGVDCDKVDDNLYFVISDGTSEDEIKISPKNDFQSLDSKAWENFTLDVKNMKNAVDINILVIRFSTDPDHEIHTYIGIDDIVLEYEKETITTTPDPSIDPNKAFFCDFDQISCGITGQFSVDESISVDGYKFTDMTSITEPAANNQNCIIPFCQSTSEQYHCTSVNNECETSSGFSKCQSGRFLWGKYTESTTAQQLSAEFPSIKTNERGFYRLSFYAFVYAPDNSCASTTDYIGVDIKDYLGGEIDSVIIRYRDEPRRKQWNYYSIEFKPTLIETKIKLLAGRLGSNTCNFYFGFDNVELYYIKDPSSTTTTTTSRSTTATSFTTAFTCSSATTSHSPTNSSTTSSSTTRHSSTASSTTSSSTSTSTSTTSTTTIPTTTTRPSTTSSTTPLTRTTTTRTTTSSARKPNQTNLNFFMIIFSIAVALRF